MRPHALGHSRAADSISSATPPSDDCRYCIQPLTPAQIHEVNCLTACFTVKAKMETENQQAKEIIQPLLDAENGFVKVRCWTLCHLLVSRQHIDLCFCNSHVGWNVSSWRSWRDFWANGMWQSWGGGNCSTSAGLSVYGFPFRGRWRNMCPAVALWRPRGVKAYTVTTSITATPRWHKNHPYLLETEQETVLVLFCNLLINTDQTHSRDV